MRIFKTQKLKKSFIAFTIAFLGIACSKESTNLFESIKQGGYVIYFRHAQTVRDYADQADPLMRIDDCSTQRKLSTIGIQQSKDIGSSFKRNQIPVASVITSDYCRSWKTAKIAFGEFKKDSRLNFLPFEEYTTNQIEEMRSNLNPFLSAIPP